MKAKYFFLALMVTYSCENVLSHIVTSSHVDLSLLACIRSLTNTVQIMCSTYGQDSPEEFYNNGMLVIHREIANWERDRTVKRCCSRPCTVAELMSLC